MAKHLTKEEKNAAFVSIVQQMSNTYAGKNENYGDSFGDLYQRLGPSSGLVPLYNKLFRLTELINHPSSNHYESIEDTMLDLACYAVMNLIEWNAAKGETSDGEQ